jgi:ABC-type Fe3+-siderophore transport system permease subunit
MRPRERPGDSASWLGLVAILFGPPIATWIIAKALAWAVKRHYGTGVGQNTQSVKVIAAIQKAMITAAATRLVGRSARLCASSRNSAMRGPGSS